MRPTTTDADRHRDAARKMLRNQGRRRKARIDLYQAQLFAYFLEKLQSMKEGDGNMHRHSDLPALMAWVGV